MKITRLLLIDDNTVIHESFRKIFTKVIKNTALEDLHNQLFDELIVTGSSSNNVEYILDSAYTGEEGVSMVQKSLENNAMYDIVFVDILMPPGFDGIEAIKRIWKIDPAIMIVIISAHFNYSFDDISKELNYPKNLLILKKPFEVFEIRQIVNSFSK